MFDKLRLKLTIIYTGIFSLLVVMIVTGCIILLGHSVLTHEKQEMRELIIHEGEEFVASGELPVSKHSIEVGRELAYMLQPGSDVLCCTIRSAAVPLVNNYWHCAVSGRSMTEK